MKSPCRLWDLPQSPVSYHRNAEKNRCCFGKVHYKRAALFVFLINILWVIGVIGWKCMGYQLNLFILVLTVVDALACIFLWMGLRANDGDALLLFIGFQFTFAIYALCSMIRFLLVVFSIDDFSINHQHYHWGYDQWIRELMTKINEDPNNETKFQIYASIMAAFCYLVAVFLLVLCYILYRTRNFFDEVKIARNQQLQKETYKNYQRPKLEAQSNA